MINRLFAVTTPGLEPFLRHELESLGIASQPPRTDAISGEPQEDAGGLEFDATLEDLYRTNLQLRTASRVLVRFSDFHASSFPELHKRCSRLAWEQYLQPGQQVALRVTCRKSKLYHSDGVAERVVAGISDHFGKPTPLTKFDENAQMQPQIIMVRLNHDHCTISLDTSGSLLHRRGYRLETAKAPLRETLAAGLLLASGWNCSAPLLDPFCGSGTIPIEAALMARCIAPGKNRRFAFMDWPNFDPMLWDTVLNNCVSKETPSPIIIQASDRDAGAIRISQENARRAGVLDSIEFTQRAVSAIQPPKSRGWIVTNPPYGVRVSRGNDLRNLYSQFGNVFRSLCPNWRFGILCSTDYLMGHAHLDVEETMPLINGGIHVKFFTGNVNARARHR